MVATPRPPCVKRSSGSRVKVPVMVTVLSAMVFPLSGTAAGSGRGANQAAALGLGIGKAKELVADDVVRESELTLEVVECATRCQQVEDGVVAVLLLVD